MKSCIKKEIFEKEIAMCQKLFLTNEGKCNWGECGKCGVVPLLYKLGKGKFCEKKEEVEKLKYKVFEKK